MTTLIAVYTSDGCIGRCDAKCYNASLPGCACICGGVNHGAGLARAITNTRELAEAWLTHYAQEKGLTEYRAEIAESVLQLPLL